MKEEDIIDKEMIVVHTLERYTLQYNTARHKVVETPSQESGTMFLTLEPISGPDDEI